MIRQILSICRSSSVRVGLRCPLLNAKLYCLRERRWEWTFRNRVGRREYCGSGRGRNSDCDVNFQLMLLWFSLIERAVEAGLWS